MKKLVLVYITNPSEEEAERIAKHLLQKKLIACANIFPIKSLYWWNGEITTDTEFVLIAKTLEENYEKLKKEVEKLHSYTIPCIIKIPAISNEKYFEWLRENIKSLDSK